MSFAPEKVIGQVVGQFYDKPTVGWRQVCVRVHVVANAGL
jgi:hypothetical protein